MELKVNEVAIPESITFNFDELKQELTEKAKMYETLVYSDEQIKEAKADRSNLNKLKKSLNDERLRREREYMKPFNEFKGQINEIISIIDKPIAIIDKQIKEAEEQKKEEKKKEIEAIWEDLPVLSWLKLEQIYNPKWLNATFSLKAIKEDMQERLTTISTDLDTLSNLSDFSFEAQEVYKQSLDINKAISEGQRLLDIQRRKEEEKRRKAEAEAKAKAEAEAKVEEDIQPTVPDKVEEVKKDTRQWVSFKAYLTVEQAKALRDFFNNQGIEFRPI